jgi:uncharacterized protein with PQ loop repeat
MSTNCSVVDSPIYQSCDCHLPLAFCALANVSGYALNVLWLFVLVPQVWRNFRHSSVQGVSPAWAILNFTATLNNTFFVFKVGNLPWYMYIYTYMPVIQAVMLLQFVIYTPRSVPKWVVAGLCCVAWAAIIIAQCFFHIYRELEWLSVALWSAEAYFQVLLNMRRRSTYGLSNSSIALTAIAKSTDFMQYYLLIMPIEYVIMGFFSSTAYQIGTLQVIYYWNKLPVGEESDIKEEDTSISRGCHAFRIVGMVFFVAELIVFAVSLLVRTRMMWLLCAPIGVYLSLLAYYLYLRKWSSIRWLRGNNCADVEATKPLPPPPSYSSIVPSSQ